jgi:hypothetical protein
MNYVQQVAHDISCKQKWTLDEKEKQNAPSSFD